MIGDRDFHHQQQANSDLHTMLGQKANLFASDSTRIGDTLAIAGHRGLSNRKFGTGIITCRRKPDADGQTEDYIAPLPDNNPATGSNPDFRSAGGMVRLELPYPPDFEQAVQAQRLP